MSLLTQASLVLTPTAYKVNKLYSIIPSSGNGDMITTRATTATRVNSSGVIENVGLNVPRLNYEGSCPSILLEPQRTNLLSYSSTFTDASWSKISMTSVLDSIILSPDGTANSYKTSKASTSTAGYITKTSATSVNTIYTISIFAKLGDVSTNFGLRCQGVYPDRGDALFNLQTGTLIGVANGGTNTNTTATIESFSNGWYKCSVTTTFLSSPLNKYLIFSPTSLTSIGGFEAPDGFLSNCYTWGGQLEVGAYPTSYIPTVASTVTRNLDDISKTGVSTDILNASEGTFYVEIAALSNDLTSRIISLSDGTDFNQIAIQFSSVSNVIRLDTYGQTGVGTTTNYRSLVTVANTTTLHKCLIRWKAGEIFAYVDGIKYILTYATGTVGGSGIPTALNRIDFKAYWGGSPFYGKCKGMQIYKTALSDAECATLTTL
jgi:hypothetical protein